MRMPEAIRAERDAEELLAKLWDQDDDGNPVLPVDPVVIARELGIEVYVADMKPDASGALYMDTGPDKPRIYLNSSDAGVRQRFSCAHELGHYMDKIERGELYGRHIEWRNGHSSTGKRPDERYANAFAAALLMPADAVRRLRHTHHPVQMALEFDVSVEAMTLRLKNLQ